MPDQRAELRRLRYRLGARLLAHRWVPNTLVMWLMNDDRPMPTDDDWWRLDRG